MWLADHRKSILVSHPASTDNIFSVAISVSLASQPVHYILYLDLHEIVPAIVFTSIVWVVAPVN